MKRSTALTPAAMWNLKNFPSSSLGRLRKTPTRGVRWSKQLPSAAADLLQRRRNVVVLSLVAVGALSLLWLFSREE